MTGMKVCVSVCVCVSHRLIRTQALGGGHESSGDENDIMKHHRRNSVQAHVGEKHHRFYITNLLHLLSFIILTVTQLREGGRARQHTVPSACR